MKFKVLNIDDAAKKMELWKKNSDKYIKDELDVEYNAVRIQLKNEFRYIEERESQKYKIDYKFGIYLYRLLSKHGFTVRHASDDNVWRFLSLNVIPDIVARRWGKTAETRYYKVGNRIWLKTIWWYIYLSYNNSLEETAKIIDTNTTDQILQLVDRAGRKGYYIDVYRNIMYYFWRARRINPELGDIDFRHIMILHTAMCRNVEPGLCRNGEKGYVEMIFNKLGIEY